MLHGVQVRLQAQLGKRKAGNVMYTGTIDCFIKTYRAEGLRGLQAGLGPSVFKEGSKVRSSLVYFIIDFTTVC